MGVMMLNSMLEHALYHPGPWTFRTALGVTTAHRIIDGDGRRIIFTGMVEHSADRIIELCAGGRMVSIAPIDDPRGNRITWTISLRDLVSIS